MANFFNLTLDTIGPASPSIAIDNNATYATSALVMATIGTSDTDKTGYQMKFWGDIDLTWAKTNGVAIPTATSISEANAQWLTFTTSKQLQLAAGDGSKTVYCKLRDDVYNESAQVSDAITLDTTKPVVTISGPDVSRVSKISGKDTVAFTFSVDSIFKAYKVKVVTAGGALENTGAQIGTANGSTNMSGTGSYPKTTPISCTINGADLEAASSGDGAKIVKVFVQDEAGNWSV